MPRMNGIDATNKIRQMNESKKTPIVAMTAFALKNDRERFLQMGMDAYISKPINMEEMFQVLEQVTIENKTPSKEKRINIVGEDIYADVIADKKTEISDNAIKKIEKCIKEIKDKVEQHNLESVEKLANEIKLISNQNDIMDIKETAFKIELAIRRGNEAEVYKYIEQIKEEIKVYQI